MPTLKKNFKTQIVVNENIYEIQIKSSNNLKVFNNSNGDFVVENVQAIHNKILKNDSINTFTDSSQHAFVNKAPIISTQSKNPFTSEVNMEKSIGNVSWPERIELSSTLSVQKKNILNDRRHVKIPHGVVPFENNLNIIQVDEDEIMKMIANRVSVATSETDADNNLRKNDISPLKELQNANADNLSGAREENDSNVADENNGEIKIDLKHQNNDLINSAVEDLNLYGSEKILKKHENSIDILNDEDIQVIQRSDVDRDNRYLMNGKKLKKEVSEDQGKAYPDETHFQVEDEDGNYI